MSYPTPVRTPQLRSQDRALDARGHWRDLEGSSLEPEWHDFFEVAIGQLLAELGECQLSPQAVIDWLYDYARELRQQPKQGLYVGTVHSAKGLEFRHVILLDGIVERDFQGEVLPALDKRYLQLSLKDIDLDFAGRQPPGASIHNALASLEPGDPLTLSAQEDRYLILDANGQIVGRTAKSFKLELDVEHCEVAGIMITRHRVEVRFSVVNELLSSFAHTYTRLHFLFGVRKRA